jgi:hypothetical protein
MFLNIKMSLCTVIVAHGFCCHTLVTTSIAVLSFSHIAYFTSVSSPLVFTLVLLFTLTAHLKCAPCNHKLHVLRGITRLHFDVNR